MHDYRALSRLMERTIHKYIQMEKKTRCYGTGIPLTQAEIHTLAAVGDCPGINVTALAKLRGVTKGAASQMVYKLVEKGLVEKRVSPHSDTEVVLSLTEDGQRDYAAHGRIHEESGKRFLQILSEMPQDYQNYFVHVFEEFEASLDEILNER